VAFLAAWSEAARSRAAIEAFTVASMRALWLEGDGEVRPEIFAELYRRACAAEPPSPLAAPEAALRANERALTRKGHWETPAARIAGEWFFAHERVEAMGERLDYLGLRARR